MKLKQYLQLLANIESIVQMQKMSSSVLLKATP
jgi:hypothetical protein